MAAPIRRLGCTALYSAAGLTARDAARR